MGREAERGECRRCGDYAGARGACCASAATSRAETVGEFAVWMRLQSLYPTFRSLVDLVYWVWVAMAVVCFAGALVGMWNGVGTGRLVPLFAGVLLGLLFMVIAKVTRELSLMMADLADAAVRIASRVRP